MPVRWQIAWTLALVTTINYIDRAALSFAAPVMLPELGLSTTQYGLVASGFFWAYAIGQVVSGRLIDRYGTKRAYSAAVVVWNVASAAHALTRGFVSLLGFRIVLGLGEAANFPASVKAISEWFPARERSLATGVLLVGPGLGAIITPLLMTWLILTLGWRWAFFISGAIGIAWLFLWQRVYFPVESHPRISAAEKQLILAERGAGATDADAALPPLRIMVRSRAVLGLMLSRFSCDGAFYFFLTFLPLYFSTQRGLNLAQTALATLVPWVFADIGGLFGGWLGKRLVESGMSIGRARKTVIWIGAILVLPVTLGALVAESLVVAVGLISIALFAIQMKSSNLLVMPADLFRTRDVATVWGLFGALGSAGAAIFQAYAGWLIDNVSWTPVFVMVSMMHLVSALIVVLMIPRVEPMPAFR